LVTSVTPIVAVVIGDDEKARKVVGNVKEIEAHEFAAAVLTNEHLQLLSYYTEEGSVGTSTGREIWRKRDRGVTS